MKKSGIQISGGSGVPRDENANNPTRKPPLTNKPSGLTLAIKEKLDNALNDMKKSVVNIKKSPWMLSRSSSYRYSSYFTVVANSNDNKCILWTCSCISCDLYLGQFKVMLSHTHRLHYSVISTNWSHLVWVVSIALWTYTYILWIHRKFDEDIEGKLLVIDLRSNVRLLLAVLTVLLFAFDCE